MEINSPTLFVEINNADYLFVVGDKNEQDDLKIIYKCIVPSQGFIDNKITNFDLVFSTIKKNIYLIEQKLNFTFQNVILIISNFDCSFINLTGFKKLNGSQILKENITYILNSMKASIDKIENEKTILHIFNLRFNLDQKKLENLPIGLFGNFYSHELSFCLINNNDYKNLNNIFNKCNLKINRVLLKSFIEGAHISDSNNNLDTFFQIKINQNNSQIFYFENNSLKFEQNFDFGTNLIIKDISKITSLKTDIINKIINNNSLDKYILSEELIEKELFENENYTKIKKKLIYEIAEARIQEILEILIIKNINFVSLDKKDKTVFLRIADKSHLKCFKDKYNHFLINNNFTIKFLENISTDDLIDSVNKLVHFGWKKEAIPIVDAKKSIIARFFDAIFS
jgi:cell division protein FtsA